MPYIDVDIDVDDYINACDTHDIKEIIELLIEHGHIKKSAIEPEIKSSIGIDEQGYEDALDKLSGKWNMLSREEEVQILKIANRLP